MDGAWVRRMRWRRRGAWLWPVFVAATILDGVIGRALPRTGDAQTFIGAALAGLLLNILAVLLLTRPLAALARRRQKGLPAIVARNYAGTAAVIGVTGVLAIVGVVHHATIVRDREAMHDAIKRAQAWIGDRAPAEFRRNLEWVSTFAIQPGSLYRACVPSLYRTRTYCVIVDTTLPFERSVRFGGYEPNSNFSQGAG
jgi:hypothetical protein